MQQEFDHRICELHNAQNQKDHEAIKLLIQTVHDGDQRLLTREVSRICKELEKVDNLELRVRSLEKWRTYILGIVAAVGVIFPVAVHIFKLYISHLGDK